MRGRLAGADVDEFRPLGATEDDLAVRRLVPETELMALGFPDQFIHGIGPLFGSAAKIQSHIRLALLIQRPDQSVNNKQVERDEVRKRGAVESPELLSTASIIGGRQRGLLHAGLVILRRIPDLRQDEHSVAVNHGAVVGEVLIGPIFRDVGTSLLSFREALDVGVRQRDRLLRPFRTPPLLAALLVQADNMISVEQVEMVTAGGQEDVGMLEEAVELTGDTAEASLFPQGLSDLRIHRHNGDVGNGPVRPDGGIGGQKESSLHVKDLKGLLRFGENGKRLPRGGIQDVNRAVETRRDEQPVAGRHHSAHDLERRNKAHFDRILLRRPVRPAPVLHRVPP